MDPTDVSRRGRWHSVHDTIRKDSIVMKHRRIFTLARRPDDARRNTESESPRLIRGGGPHVDASRVRNDVAGAHRGGAVRRLNVVRNTPNESPPRGDPPTAA